MVVTFIGAIAVAQEKQEGATEIPKSLKTDHEALHEDLAKLLGAEDAEVAAAAKEVAEKLHAHFVKEEEIAMPPLGALVPLSKGQEVKDRARLIEMTDKLKAEMPKMLAEHKEIVTALDKLATAASKAKHKEAAAFAAELKAHAGTEEEVLYPAALLVGEVLKKK